MTLSELFQLDSIFTDLDEFLGFEENWFIKGRWENLMDERLFEIYTSDLDCISNSWRLNEDSLKLEFKELEDNILRAIGDLESIYFTAENFDWLLDCISVRVYCSCIVVSSIYSNYTVRGLTWDDAYSAVGTYIERLVERGELVLEEDFLWDTGFCEALNEKFGVDDWEEDCEDNEDVE